MALANSRWRFHHADFRRVDFSRSHARQRCCEARHSQRFTCTRVRYSRSGKGFGIKRAPGAVSPLRERRFVDRCAPGFPQSRRHAPALIRGGRPVKILRNVDVGPIVRIRQPPSSWAGLYLRPVAVLALAEGLAPSPPIKAATAHHQMRRAGWSATSWIGLPEIAQRRFGRHGCRAARGR